MSDRKLTVVKKATKQEKQRRFLEAFAEHANVLLSARAAGISRQMVYKWLEHDEAFSFAYNQAKEDAKDILRAEIYRRAVEGWDEPLVSAGKLVGKVRKYSDTLLIFHSKMLMPEYREKQQVEHSGSIDVNGAKDSLLLRLGTLPREQNTALD